MISVAATAAGSNQIYCTVHEFNSQRFSFKINLINTLKFAADFTLFSAHHTIHFYLPAFYTLKLKKQKNSKRRLQNRGQSYFYKHVLCVFVYIYICL